MDDTQLIEVDAGRGLDVSNGHDAALLRRAIKQNWTIPEEYMQKAPAAAGAIAFDPNRDDRSRIAAMRLLVAMHGQNQKDDPAIRHVEHHHELGPITAANMEERRQQLRELAIANGHIPADRISENTGRAGGVVAVGPAEAGRASEVDRDNALGGG